MVTAGSNSMLDVLVFFRLSVNRAVTPVPAKLGDVGLNSEVATAIGHLLNLRRVTREWGDWGDGGVRWIRVFGALTVSWLGIFRPPWFPYQGILAAGGED